MGRSKSSADLPLDQDEQLADLLEQISQQIEAGVHVDLDQYVRQFPLHADQLQKLVPALQALDSLGRVAPDDSSRPSWASSNLNGNLGEFRILREIGRGGMGVVFEAEQAELQRPVALKVLPFAAVMEKRQLVRFHHEARAAATLDHPNIVKVYSVGCQHGVHYYAMQLIEGNTLAEIIRALGACQTADNHCQAFPVAETLPRFNQPEFFRFAAQLGIQAAEALQHAHHMGIVHRDIKPSNLMVDAEGHLWITDFGLVLIETETQLTMSGDVLGTLRYMSPEQASGEPRELGPPADIYSLGITLYELLTLRPAFDSEDQRELLQQVTSRRPPGPRQLNATIPRDLETIILKATSKRPELRYDSARALADDLRCFRDHLPIRATRPSLAGRAVRHRGMALSVAAAILIMLVVAMGMAFWRKDNQRARDQLLDTSVNASTTATTGGQGKEVRDQAVRDHPDSESVYFGRAVYRTNSLQDYDGALADFDRSIKLDPQFGLAHYNRGLVYYLLGQPRRAVEDWSAAIELGWRESAVFSNRGVLRVVESDVDGALADFQQALRVGPQRSELFNNRGVVRALQGDAAGALVDLDRAIALNATCVAALVNRAVVHAQAGRIDDSLADLDTAKAARPLAGGEQHELARVIARLPDEPSFQSLRARANELFGAPLSEATKTAGEPPLPMETLTGPASPRRFVCAPGGMALAILSQTIDHDQREDEAMKIAKRKQRQHTTRPHRLQLERLEPRNLLATISGTVFEDLDADGIRDIGEPGIANSTVILERLDISQPLLTIANPYPDPGDEFGFAMAPIGNNLVVGAMEDDPLGVHDAGAVYLFDAEVGGDPLITFDNPDPQEFDRFGCGVAAFGNDVLVGTRRSWQNDVGVAYLFDGSNGQLLQTFYDPNPEAGATLEKDGFGDSTWALTTVHNRVAIADAKDDAAEDESGAVFVFDVENGFEPVLTITSPNANPGDRFGASIATLGNNLLVGAPGDDSAGPDTGAVYLFEGATGELLATFTNPSPQSGEEFGRWVSALDGKVLTSATYRDVDGVTDAGEAYMFDGDSGELLQTFSNPAPDPPDEIDDRFGTLIRGHDDQVIVVAAWEDLGGNDRGAVYAYKASTGEFMRAYTDPTPNDFDHFGGHDDWFLENGSLAIATLYDDENGVDSGSVFIFGPMVEAVTDAAGAYSFSDLEAGLYEIRQISNAEMSQTAPKVQGTYAVTIETGTSDVSEIDFGYTAATTYQLEPQLSLKDAKPNRPGVTSSAITVPDAGVIRDVNVTLNIDHGREHDLDVVLIAPDGQRIPMFSDVGDANELLTNLTLDDEAGEWIEVAAQPYGSLYRPESRLAVLDGIDADGQWTLEITDDTRGETGTLHSWGLTIARIYAGATAGITVEPTDGLVTSENLGTDTFSVVLDSQPTADVTVGITSSDTTEGTVSTAQLVFTDTDWNVPQTVTVTGVNDDDTDGNVAYQIITAAAVSDDPAYDGLNPDDVHVTNMDNDTPTGTSDLTIDDVMLAEGKNRTTDFVFTVTRTGETSTTVTVNYATADGTAVVDSDYIGTSGMLTFAPDQTTQTITVPVNGDRTPEPDEAFYVNLSDASSNATISDTQGEGTIVNDDGQVSLAGFEPQSVLPVGGPRLVLEMPPRILPPEMSGPMDVVVGESGKRALTHRELYQARILDRVAEMLDEDLLDLLAKG